MGEDYCIIISNTRFEFELLKNQLVNFEPTILVKSLGITISPTNGLGLDLHLHLPHPTPNTMLSFIQPTLQRYFNTQLLWGEGGGRGLRKLNNGFSLQMSGIFLSVPRTFEEHCSYSGNFPFCPELNFWAWLFKGWVTLSTG